MAKYTKRQHLKKEEETNLIIEFCNAVASLSSTEEAALFIKDILSKQETRMMAKRLKIAKLLIRGKSYIDIATELKVGQGTIARINLWLNQSGEGYRLALSRTKDVEMPQKPTFGVLRRRYPMYHWPEILLKEIIYSANKKQREKLENIINNLDSKSELYRELGRILRQNSHTL
ncbi:hypothetical protein A2V71_03465 [Candidatus Berkelbacteria bacterium RBG_13_40_8]|uniref:TrpR like protein, YerC/YecD n=1 Tax=Candidatus Berkelbacteria bacterium RBG_13_40_8 TaxID=1797467 RepID=A0A1F5DQI2_9BACT|nr:MAG: hypothetical protein A2V71_03465 [Candidatus Berkelbacteria bacterium RBG_13_40_8]